MLLVTADRLLEVLLKASFTAGVAFLVVAAARLTLKRVSKRWSYIMWAVVFFRCVCPFSAESGISVFNIFRLESVDETDVPAAVVYELAESPSAVPEEAMQNILFSGEENAERNERSGRDFPVTQTVQNVPPKADRYDKSAEQGAVYNGAENRGQLRQDMQTAGNIIQQETAANVGASTVFIIVWLCGAAAMALYGIFSAVRLTLRVKTAVRTDESVYESDRIATAFAAGILRPRIYIPCGIPENERRLIIMHERVHIRRRDYLVKLLAFTGLVLHWFNPLIWAAFGLMTRDMEMSCDEAVLKKCGIGDRILYAEALLRVSVKGFGAAAAVGFGETGIKERVKNVLNYKKPSRLAAVLAAALMFASCAAAGTDAVTDNADNTDKTGVSDGAVVGELLEKQRDEEMLKTEESRLKKGEGKNVPQTADGKIINGTEQDTIEIKGKTYYFISNEEQLRAISAGEYGMDKNFLQNGNIQLSSDEWLPIGTKEAPFKGSYNGNGFEISGLTMKDPDAARVGMFGYAENAHIYNITLRDYDIASAGRNALQRSVAPILPVVTNGTRCYDNRVYPAEKVLIKPCPADAEISEQYNAESADGMHKHNGIDYRVIQGTEIYAAADGKIISCDNKQSGYGTCIIIDHGDGLTTVYAHLSKSLVSLEDEVSAGGLIGYSGSTGYAFGNNLHFEVRQDGQCVDPLLYLKD